MRRAKLLGAIVGVVLLVSAAGAVLTFLRSGRPLRGGEHELAGLERPVAVRWDRWGVPGIRAESEADLAAAMGWIHANDRFTQMELGRRAAFGRLSEVLGEATVEIDVYFRRLRLGRIAHEMLAGAGARTRLWLEAYASGVNAWLAERGSGLPPELRLLGVRPEPWESVHSIAFALLMARDLSFWRGFPEEQRFQWLRAFGADAVGELLGEPDVHVPAEILALAATLPDPSPPPSDRDEGPDLAAPGSNNWALAPARTASGQALVANDPHLGLGLPSVWYQVQLRAPGFEAAGMSLPGAPGVVLGRGSHVAWAFTHSMVDDQDLFFEKLDDVGERYLRGEEWKPIEREEETIRIRGGGTRTVVLRSTDRGPLFEADAERGLPPRSLAWTGYEGGDPLAMLLELPRAATPEELHAAVEPFVCPSQNLVAAFDSGEILFTVIGRLPRRRQGDGRLPSPGWDPDYGWDGLLPRRANPAVLDPEDGLLVTANDDVVPSDYPLPFVADFFPGHRSKRIRGVLTERETWDWESVGELQNDVVSLYAAELLAALAEELEGEAGRALAEWDHEMAATGPSALYILFERELLGVFTDEAEAAGVSGPNAFDSRDLLLRLLRGEVSPAWFDDVATTAVETRAEAVSAALGAAWAKGRERWGGDVERWSFGGLHRLTLTHDLDAIPVLGRWMRRGPFEVPGSATTVAAFGAAWRGDRMEVVYGPSMRWVVDWGQPDMAFAMLPGGQSGHPADPHYADQVAPFLAGRLRPAPWSEEQIESVKVTSMLLVPAR